ncbi:hypothetical protein, partial [Arthrobacter sp. Edens01]|uniref:hypothetical protein n=1 Tax=Arthrobacter sp. Edens01 TaxID=1732020 RepID=UPI0006D9705E
MLGDPFTVDLFEVAQLRTGDLVQLLACNVVVDFRRAFPVSAVGAAQVTGIVLAFGDGSFVSTVALWAVVVLAERLPLTPIVVERLTVTPIVTEGTTLTITRRTITPRLTIPITTSKRLTLTPVVTEGTTLTITRRTITPRLTIPITTSKRLTLTPII